MAPVLSVVLPAYNEAAGITEVLAELLDGVKAGGVPFEVIVVDDGSRDGTADRIAAFEEVKVVRHETNRGYGAALKTGIRQAEGTLICITDADGTYPNRSIPELTRLLMDEGADMCVGARVGARVAIPLIRRPAKWVLGRLAAFVSGVPIPDLNSGLRVFRRDAALRFFGLLPDGFSFTTTITLGMLTNGYLVRFVPIDYRARVGRSKIRPIRDTLGFLQLVLRIALYFAPLRFFMPLSVGVFALAVAVGVFTKFVLGQLADVATLVLVTAGVQIGVIGLLAELIDVRMRNDVEKR